MSTFNFIPDFGATKDVKPRVSVIQFGDGYAQRVANGLNTRPETWSLTFANRSLSDADAIEAFFNARNGVEAFDWTPPDGVLGKYVCSQWTRSVEKANLYSLTATFTQVFDV